MNGFIFSHQKDGDLRRVAKPGGIPAATSIFGEDHGQSSGLQGLRVGKTDLRDHFLGIQKFRIYSMCVCVCIYMILYVYHVMYNML